MGRYERANFAERTEVVVVFVLLGASYFVVVAPLLADIHPMFATSGGQAVADRYLQSPREWAVIPWLIFGLWLYSRLRRRIIGPFETIGAESDRMQ